MWNVLFSTTRQWNPGDEFILFGVRRIFAEIGLRHNAIIFNRNPAVNPALTAFNPLRRVELTMRGREYVQSFVRIGSTDNSYKPGTIPDYVDLAVFAGTPAWSSRENYPMYEGIKAAKLPVCYLGIGGFARSADSQNTFVPLVEETLRKALVITTRDQRALELTQQFGAQRLPCPALLSASVEKTISEVRTIGLIYSATKTHRNHSIPEAAHRSLVEIYRRIRERYARGMRVVFIAHYIDEVPDIYRYFGDDAEVLYSYDAREYVDIYRQLDVVLGTRVHGIGMAASVGVPGIHLGHDGRAGTVAGFKAANIELTHGLDSARLDADMHALIANAAARNAELKQHKRETLERYCTLLRERLSAFLPGADVSLPPLRAASND